MRAEKLILSVLFFALNFTSTAIFCQNINTPEISFNIPSKSEAEHNNTFNPNESELLILEKQHKEAMESGDITSAENIKSRIYSLIPDESKKSSQEINSEVKVRSLSGEPEVDWSDLYNTIATGSIVTDSVYNKKLQLKMGEDNVLYAAVCLFGSGGSSKANLILSKSTNNGINWTGIYNIFLNDYVGNISLLVESRNNGNPDSTRLFLFYTYSGDIDANNAKLGYITVLSNGSNYSIRNIANPPAASQFRFASAVSDGAFYQNATYLGVICAVSDNALHNTQYLRFYRTIDWGATWVSSDLSTGFNDLQISADFKRSVPDSVCIAVERNFSSTDRQLRVLFTPWIPSSNFRTFYLTNGTDKYERPCLAIKQNSPVDSMVISCTKNNTPYYHYSTNAGITWYVNQSLDPSNPANVSYTYCSSTSNGDSHFIFCWQNMSSDSVNIRRGAIGNPGQIKYKVNLDISEKSAAPVCEIIPVQQNYFSGMIYFHYSSPFGFVKFNDEAHKKLIVYVIPEAYYIEGSNNLYNDDSVSVYIRKAIPPYNVIDSSKAILFKNVYVSTHSFYNIPDNIYYIELRHRNSIGVWSKNPVDFGFVGTATYNFTTSADKAYGDNQLKVDNNPERYGLYSGDVNQDGNVNLTDIIKVFNDASDFLSGYVASDVNGDNLVNLTDLIVTYNNSAGFASMIRP